MKSLAVIMPTYNAALYLSSSISSVLAQSFSEFDFYIYDDYSNDESFKIINSFEDDRIIYVRNERNLGIASTLNKAIEDLSYKYKYLARMDADDWCFPNRFEKQLDFLSQNEDYLLCGTQGYWLTDIDSEPTSSWAYPISSKYLNYYLLFACSFGHSSIIFNTKVFLRDKIQYNESIRSCEDWELWTRISTLGPIGNLPDYLMKYRIVADSQHRSKSIEELHLQERSSIISQHFQTFGIIVNADTIYDLYYRKVPLENSLIYKNFKMLISIFTQIESRSKEQLSMQEQKDFRYMLLRRTINFWQRSGMSKFDVRMWIYLFKDLKYASNVQMAKTFYLNLIKGL